MRTTRKFFLLGAGKLAKRLAENSAHLNRSSFRGRKRKRFIFPCLPYQAQDITWISMKSKTSLVLSFSAFYSVVAETVSTKISCREAEFSVYKSLLHNELHAVYDTTDRKKYIIYDL